MYKLRFIPLLFLLPSLALGQLSEEKRKKLDTFFQHIAENNRAMGTVSLMEGDKEVYSYSMGMANHEEQKEANASSIYRIGSISKTFTAAIIMQLVEEKRIQLATPLHKFYPEFLQAKEITIEHLLRHRSGIYNFTDDEKYTSWMEQAQKKEELLELLASRELDFAPGSKESYSNSGYLILSWIIEDVEGMLFADVLNKRISKRFELPEIYYAKSEEPKDEEVKSYTAGQPWQEATKTHSSVSLGAGGIVATASALNRFYYLLFQGKVVSPLSLEIMKKQEGNLGMGLFSFPFYEHRAIGHTGGIDGFASNAAYFPKEELTVALCLNASRYSMNNIMVGLLSTYFDKPFELPEFGELIENSEEELDVYVGTYGTEGFPLDIRIFREGLQLRGQGTGQPDFPLDCTAKHQFVFEQAGLKIRFDVEKKQLHLSQGGSDFVLDKKED